MVDTPALGAGAVKAWRFKSSPAHSGYFGDIGKRRASRGHESSPRHHTTKSAFWRFCFVSVKNLVKNIFVRRRVQKFLDPARATMSADMVPALTFKSLHAPKQKSPNASACGSFVFVSVEGLEPSRITPCASETHAYTNSATRSCRLPHSSIFERFFLFDKKQENNPYL